MKLLHKLSALSLATALAGCQTVAPNKVPDPVDPAPPTLRSQPAPSGTAPASSAATPPGASATSTAPATQRLSATVITLHLAQNKAEASLVPVDVGGSSLYALPQPVLTQTDMARVQPVTAADKRTYVLLEMNQRGIPKLQRITEQARGHHLLLSVQGQLVSVATIGQTINDGRLMVSTQGPEHTQAIIKLMQGN